MGNVLVSVTTFEGSEQVWRFSPEGESSVVADLGQGMPGSQIAGLALDVFGNVYVAQLRGDGVYKVDQKGEVALLPGTEQIVGADALAFDQRGTLYISEIFSYDSSGEFAQGGIWRVRGGEVAELWLRHELLTGSSPLLFPYPVGANGLAFYHGALYVANTDKALVVRIPVLPDGSPGEPEVWKAVQELPEALFALSPFPLMPDGLALDVHGNVYLAVPSRNAIIRINAADRSQETIAVFPPMPTEPPVDPLLVNPLLDAPLSLAFGTGRGERQSLFITDSGLLGPMAGGTWAGPGLLKVHVGMPGLPLP